MDEVKSRIDWLKDLFKILITIMVADIAGISKLFMDNRISLLFYMGVSLLPILAAGCIMLSRKIEIHLNELGGI